MPATNADTPPVLCRTPNQHTRPTGLRLGPGTADFLGYQEFTASRDRLRISPTDVLLARKATLLDPLLQPSELRSGTVLDLGANNGYFSLLALQRGASHATAVDLDAACVANLAAARAHLGIGNLDVEAANVVEWDRPADCVLALALSHWLCACTASLGSLDAVVMHLAGLTRHLLLLEFVEADDPAIKMFGHLSWQGQRTDGYSRELFEAALHRHFSRVQRIGDMSATRSLYAAFKAYDIEPGCPLPLVLPRNTLLSCRNLALIDDEPLWSAVYDRGDAIVKQTSGNLALREAQILTRLAGAGTPAVLETHASEDWSVAVIERIDGRRLSAVRAELVADRPRFVRFVRGCLAQLQQLRDMEVVHRDIHEHNVLVRDDLPILIDFGWAVAPGIDIVPPPTLNAWCAAMTEPGATPEHCDVRAMGRLLLTMSGGRHPDLDGLFGIMAEPAVARRVVDIDLLRRWLDALEGPDLDAAARAAGVLELLALAEARRTFAGGPSAPQPAAILDVEALHARLDVALTDGGSLGPLGASESEHLTEYARRLRESGYDDQARAVATCVAGSLPPEDPAWAALAYMCASIDASMNRIDDALDGFHRVSARARGPRTNAFVAGAAFHTARLLAGRSQVDDARRHVARCLALMPDHREAMALAERLGCAGVDVE